MPRLSLCRFLPTSSSLLRAVIISGLALVITIVLLFCFSLNLISSGANRIDNHRAVVTVDGAIQSRLRMIQSMTVDNAVWDEAARAVYQTPVDHQWLTESLASDYKVNRLYDGTLVLDENFRVIWGSVSRQPYTEVSTAFLGKGLQAVIQKERHLLSTGQNSYSGLTITDKGVALLGIGLIRPVTGVSDLPAGMKRYLVVIQYMNKRMLNELDSSFKINKPVVSASPEGELSIPLKAVDESVLGYLSWQPELPGARAARQAAGDILFIIILSIILILTFILFSYTGIYRLAVSEKNARTAALTDWLSGLPNRRSVAGWLNKYHSDGRITLVIIDLDGFKAVNDIYGHDTGDRLIIHLSSLLKELVPDKGILARLGGDEFAMANCGSDSEHIAYLFAQRVLCLLGQPVNIDGKVIHTGASIGIASYNGEKLSCAELFRRADIAMYDSKSSGKHRISHYSRLLDSRLTKQKQTENELRAGLANNEFDVVYQPVIDTRTLCISSVEALVRWPRRPGGEMFPDEFIPIAESSGLITPLGEFVLRRAFRDILPLKNIGLSVNISPAQLEKADFLSTLQEILRESEFPSERIQVEITETWLSGCAEQSKKSMNKLRSLGIRLALDDFGAGYASIGYLRRFSFDVVKIDKSLVSIMDADLQALALVRATISVSGALGMGVTAEGVETEKQMDLLIQSRCDKLQGFYFSKPLGIIALKEQYRINNQQPQYTLL